MVYSILAGAAQELIFPLSDRHMQDHITHHNRGVKLIFTGGHISLAVVFKGPK